MDKTYDVTLTASFKYRAKDSAVIREKIRHLLIREDFDDANFEIGIVLSDDRPQPKHITKQITLPAPKVPSPALAKLKQDGGRHSALKKQVLPKRKTINWDSAKLGL